MRLLGTRRAIQAIGACVTDRERLGFVAPTLVLMWLTASAAAWVLEHDVNPALRTFGDALHWTFLTASTIGYGDASAVTADGRLLAGLLGFVGLGLLTGASAQLTTYLLHQPGQATAAEVNELRTEIAGLRHLLEDERS